MSTERIIKLPSECPIKLFKKKKQYNMEFYGRIFFSFNREEENWCHEMLKEHRKKIMKTFHSDLYFMSYRRHSLSISLKLHKLITNMFDFLQKYFIQHFWKANKTKLSFLWHLPPKPKIISGFISLSTNY